MAQDEKKKPRFQTGSALAGAGSVPAAAKVMGSRAPVTVRGQAGTQAGARRAAQEVFEKATKKGFVPRMLDKVPGARMVGKAARVATSPAGAFVAGMLYSPKAGEGSEIPRDRRPAFPGEIEIERQAAEEAGVEPPAEIPPAVSAPPNTAPNTTSPAAPRVARNPMEEYTKTLTDGGVRYEGPAGYMEGKGTGTSPGSFGFAGDYTGPTSTSGMSAEEKAAFEQQRQADIRSNVERMEGDLAAMQEVRKMRRNVADGFAPNAKRTKSMGPALGAPDMQEAMQDYATGRVGAPGYRMARNLMMKMKGGRASPEALAALAEGSTKQEIDLGDAIDMAGLQRNLANDQYNRQQDQFANQLDLQRFGLEASKAQDARAAGQREFEAGAPGRATEQFEAIQAGAQAARELGAGTPVLNETGIDPGVIYQQIATKTGDPQQAMALFQQILSKVQSQYQHTLEAGRFKKWDEATAMQYFQDEIGRL